MALPRFDDSITEEDFFFTSEKRYNNCQVVKQKKIIEFDTETIFDQKFS